MTYLGQHRAFATDQKVQFERDEIELEFGVEGFVTRYEEEDNYLNPRVCLIDPESATVFAVAWMDSSFADATLQLEG